MKLSNGPTTVGPETTSTDPEHERDLEGEIEEQIGGNRPDRPGDEDPEGHQPAVDASDAAGQLAEVQAEPGLEEDDPDGDRDHGGDQVLAQQCVGVECVDRARAEPKREQDQDRWEPEHLGDQGRRCRQHQDQPSFEQGSRFAERRHRKPGERVDHRCGALGPRLPSRSPHGIKALPPHS